MLISKWAKFWLFLGIALFASFLGYLLGASSTPVAGVFLTAALGILASVGSLLPAFLRKTEVANSPSETAISTNSMLALTGQVIVVFAVFLIGGTTVGTKLRLNFIEYTAFQPEPDSSAVFGKFPWNETSKPRNGQEAIDWCMTQNTLISMGLSEEQIREIYLIYRFPTANVDSARALIVPNTQKTPPEKKHETSSGGSGKYGGALVPYSAPSPDSDKIIPIKTPSSKPKMQDWQKVVVPSQNFKKYEPKKQ